MQGSFAARSLSPGRSQQLGRAVLVGGLTAAAIEIMVVLVIQGLLLHVAPSRILQSIASGLIGSRAYSGGAASAMLGALLHTAISLVAAAMFVIAANRWPRTLDRPVLSGLAYGVVVWFVMSYVVVPMSAAAFGPARAPGLIAMSIAVHMFFFGLPIALASRRVLAEGRRGDRDWL